MYLFTDQMVAFFSNKIHIENVDIAFKIFPRNTSELCVCVLYKCSRKSVCEDP